MTPNKCKCNWYPSVVQIADQLWGCTLGYYVYCENCGHSSRIMSTQDEAICDWNETDGQTNL